MNLKKKVLLILIILGFVNVSAQQRWNLELTAGPSLTYTYFESEPSVNNLSEVSRLRYVGGMAVFYALSPQFEIGSEIGFASRAVGLKITNIAIPNGAITKYVRTFGINSFVFGAGPRWNFKKNNIGFYIHPTIGLISNPDNLAIGQLNLNINQQTNINTATYRHLNSLGFYSKIDLGIQLYTKNNNYFIVSLRHLQGFVNLEEFSSDNLLLMGEEFSFTNRNKGTHSSVNLGYGIAMNNLRFGKNKKAKTNLKPSKVLDGKDENSEYIALTGGVRIREEGGRNPQDLYSNFNGIIGLFYGYRFRHLSLELGISNYYGSNAIKEDHPDRSPLFYIDFAYSTWVLPMQFRYDINLDAKKKYRLGALASFQYILNTASHEGMSGGFNGRFTSGSTEINYQGTYASNNLEVNNRHLFKVGLFIESRISRSSYAFLQISQNFRSPILSSFDAQYSINGGSILSKTFESTINGPMLEIGLKKPLRIFKMGENPSKSSLD